MKILALIPARMGSKRVPGKNIKNLGGNPLISYTIQAARDSGVIDEIMVSTDCPNIAAVSQEFGATVPWLRSNNLADDSSNVVDAVLETLDRYNEKGMSFDSVCLLQPTSPFRTSDSIRQAVDLHRESGESVVSVSRAKINPSWLKKVSVNDTLEELFPSDFYPEFKDIYQLNGSIYLAHTKHLIENKSFYSKQTKALIIDNPIETIDIDTPLDWMLVEKVMDIKKLNPLFGGEVDI